ncbi:hypothetical protein [Roseobacter litoralis]|uniref:Uncharacterized protein n=1 Tax=Roseobacter litoralis (strain ATCC 49566 / DSM 6996 / JCM 21268 / NBRC 15278 / OCh 149) TaxID=391595 RepID=F7ZG88_ROSLO|nr:hypothetical protein [Roseobacter litoralis]AEI94819.1 hypothetical protein RLO149_c028590 [Roseobacter litoralis Och 149]
MVWIFSSLAALVALVLVLAAAPDTGVQMFQMGSDAANEAADWQSALRFVAAVCVGLWFGREFGQWAEAGEKGDSQRSGLPSDTIDDLQRLLQTRAFTTSLRFWLWSILYGLFVAIGFLIVVFFPAVANELQQALALILGQSALFDFQVGGGGLMAGVAMSVLFARSVWEGKLRRFFQRRALIPEEARRIYQELKHTIFDYRPPDHDLELFLEQQAEDSRTPTYFDFEFDSNRVQQADKRMELLPRVAFMCWQIKRLLPQHVGFEAMRRNGQEFERMAKSVEAFEKTAMVCKDRLVSVLDGLVKLEEAIAAAPHLGANDTEDIVKSLDVRASVAANTNLTVDILEKGALPVSRLDNIALALVAELNSLGARLGRYNELQARIDQSSLKRIYRSATAAQAMQEAPAAFAGHHGGSEGQSLNADYERLTTRLETLRKQLAAVQSSLVPVSVDRLKALDEKMEADNRALVNLGNSFIGVIVCAGLTAYTTPNRKFYQAFGLNPTLGYVRFRFERALMLIAGPLAVYFFYLIAMAAQKPDQGFQFAIWFLFGTLFIAGSIVYGCVHGAALASVAIENHRAIVTEPSNRDTSAMGRFNLLHGFFAFLFSTAFLIIGVYVLCLCLAFNVTVGNSSAEAHSVFQGAWPFASVAAVWSVLCARITLCASLNYKSVVSMRDWVLFPALCLLSSGLVFGFLTGSGLGSETPWGTVFGLAAVLTLAVLAGAQWSVDTKKPGRADS